MPQLLPSEKIYSATSQLESAGRGVFAKVAIKKGEIIELCPVLSVSEDDTAAIHEESLVTYMYYYGDKKEKAFIPLGFGVLYNHSSTPNAKYAIQPEERIITFFATQDIAKDEEITVNYSQDNKETTPLWFTAS